MKTLTELLYNDKKHENCVPVKIDSFIRLEHMREDFHKLPFVDEEYAIPHWNKTKTSMKIKLTPRAISAIQEKFYDDFIAFGYDFDPPEKLVMKSSEVYML